MIYEDEVVRLEPFERERHLTAQYRSWFHDPVVTRHNSHGLFPLTKHQMDAFIRVIEEGSEEKIIWAIIDKQVCEEQKTLQSLTFIPAHRRITGHVGNVTLQNINLHNRSAELAIVIGDTKSWGKGVGRRACSMVLDHGFLKLSLNRIWTGTAVVNLGMQRIAEKIGMTQEGVFREGMYLNGQFVDIVAFGITRHHYNLHKSNIERLKDE